MNHTPHSSIGVAVDPDFARAAAIGAYGDATSGQAQVKASRDLTLHLSGTPASWRHLAKVIEDAAMDLERQIAELALDVTDPGEHYPSVAAESGEGRVPDLMAALEQSVADAKERRLAAESAEVGEVSERDAGITAADLPGDLIVGTMCHCDDPDDCYDHWEFFTDAEMGSTSEDHVRTGRPLNERQMRAIASFIRAAAVSP